jgi:sugar-specific transcriptional regulator TrmB
MPDAKKALRNFGLTENEVEVYLILLKLGSASASDIAEKTQIHRINLYDLLERLQEKGLVSYVMMGKRKHYEAVDPKRILEIEEEKKESIKEVIPELLNQRLLSKSQQDATIFKDKKGIKNILEEITHSKTEVCLFASGWGFKKNFSDYYDIWYSRLKMNKIKLRTLISSKFKIEKKPKVGKYGLLPSEFVFPTTTCLYDNKVLILIWGDPSSNPMGIIIRGKQVSESYREYFNMLWKIAKKQVV